MKKRVKGKRVHISPEDRRRKLEGWLRKKDIKSIYGYIYTITWLGREIIIELIGVEVRKTEPIKLSFDYARNYYSFCFVIRLTGKKDSGTPPNKFGTCRST